MLKCLQVRQGEDGRLGGGRFQRGRFISDVVSGSLSLSLMIGARAAKRIEVSAAATVVFRWALGSESEAARSRAVMCCSLVYNRVPRWHELLNTQWKSVASSEDSQ